MESRSEDVREEKGGIAFGRLLQRGLTLLRPAHQHSVASATLLLMISVLLSRVIGLVRDVIIAYLFGAGVQTDAYNAAFTLPDQINYFLAGGTASITFISILGRYREAGREAEAERAFSVIITIMVLVLGAGIVAGEILTPAYTGVFFPGFSEPERQLCIKLTRILLPAPLFFYTGGVFSAVVLARRQFMFQALAPLLYNLCIILGGLLLASRFGVTSLAIGALAGAAIGPFLINAIGAHRTGIRYRPAFDVSHPAFREWVRLSIPLMLGVSLVTADDWILRYFASHGAGDISRLNYAKRLFSAPMAIIGQAAGTASLPFLTSLFGARLLRRFADTINDYIYRIAALSLLASSWMLVTAWPLVDLIFRRGHFNALDSRETGAYFFVFALSLVFWSAQGIYARAFYAAGDTFTPMVAGTAVTLVTIPAYGWLFRAFGATGLAVASDIGILIQTLVLAVLLNRRGWAPIGGLPWGQIGKAIAAATAAAATAMLARELLPNSPTRRQDFVTIALTSVIWLATTFGTMRALRFDFAKLLSRSTQQKATVAGPAPM